MKASPFGEFLIIIISAVLIPFILGTATYLLTMYTTGDPERSYKEGVNVARIFWTIEAIGLLMYFFLD